MAITTVQTRAIVATPQPANTPLVLDSGEGWTTPAVGALLLAYFVNGSSPGTPSISPDWTLIGSVNAQANVKDSWWYRIADGTAADLTCPFQSDASDNIVGLVQEHTGLGPNPQFTRVTVIADTTVTSIDVPAVATAAPETLYAVGCGLANLPGVSMTFTGGMTAYTSNRRGNIANKIVTADGAQACTVAWAGGTAQNAAASALAITPGSTGARLRSGLRL